MADENLVDDDVKYHQNRRSDGITEVTAWSLIPIKESNAFKIHQELGVNSLPQNFKIEQKKDGAYVSTWFYCDYERIDNDG